MIYCSFLNLARRLFGRLFSARVEIAGRREGFCLLGRKRDVVAAAGSDGRDIYQGAAGNFAGLR
jgi:hypothetical protein